MDLNEFFLLNLRDLFLARIIISYYIISFMLVQLLSTRKRYNVKNVISEMTQTRSKKKETKYCFIFIHLILIYSLRKRNIYYRKF